MPVKKSTKTEKIQKAEKTATLGGYIFPIQNGKLIAAANQFRN